MASQLLSDLNFDGFPNKLFLDSEKENVPLFYDMDIRALGGKAGSAYF